VRSDHRGLGYQSHGYYQHLSPVKTLHVHMTSNLGTWTPYAEHREAWYPDVRSANYDGHTGRLDDEAAIRWLLADVDVLLSAETFYDFRVIGWAREAGVKTVLVGNPEFLRPEVLVSPPDVLVMPSRWRLDTIPNAVHLPQPVDRSVFAFTPRPLVPDRLRFLHVVGHRAARDRAGTDLVLDCIRFLRHRIDLTIRCQGSLSAPQQLLLRGLRRHQIPTVLLGDVDDPRALYEGYDVLLAPRRYGGLSLTLNEATSCGLAIIATDREPERFALPAEALVPAYRGRDVQFQGGTFTLDDANPRDLAEAIDRLVDDPAAVARLSAASDAYGESISWETLAPKWRALLERATTMTGVGP
jgi:glycosyltransferase involved in cell wall biosynthesis